MEIAFRPLGEKQMRERQAVIEVGERCECEVCLIRERTKSRNVKDDMALKAFRGDGEPVTL